MTRRLPLALLALLAVFRADLPAEDAGIERALQLRDISDVRISPDGATAAYVVTRLDFEENVRNSDVWLTNLASGESFALTRGRKRDDTPRWSPDGRRVAFVSDRNGKANVWEIAPDGGEAQAISEFDKLAVSDFAWLPDDGGLLLLAVDPPDEEEEKRNKDKRDAKVIDRDLKYARLYRFKKGQEEPEKLTTEDRHIIDFDLSPDGRAVVFSAAVTPKANDRETTDLFLLNLDDKRVEALVARPGPDTSPKYSADGEWIAFAARGGKQDPHANTYLFRVRPDGSGLENVAPQLDERVGGNIVWSPDGKFVFDLAPQGIAVRLFRFDVAAKKAEPVADFDREGATEDFALAPDGETLALVYSDPASPHELRRLSLKTGELTTLSSLNQSLGGDAPVSERFRYASSDGWRPEGLLVKPGNFDSGKTYPLLVVVHGGPASVHNLSFRPRSGAWPLHRFVEEGYVLFLPNPRGSTGFGEEYRRAVVADWGYGDYEDIMAGVDALIDQGVADPERMGVMGWSYGGFMTAWMVTQTQRFKAASVGAGITNAISMYGTQDVPDYFESHFGDVKPWEATQKYLRHSAVNFASNARTPTLLQHGGEDNRVPLGQAQEFYLALQKVGVETEMVVYPRQGHGITEPKLIRDALERSLAWFTRWLSE